MLVQAFSFKLLLNIKMRVIRFFNETAADISSQQYHDFSYAKKVSSCSDINVRGNKTATQRRELIFT
ncbi:hypothetical protein, partial [Salmonella enterica]|uniref:hypothetical protein n=1 Tax=Salmonella enterica TaxID=28901 RepID=UPI00325B222F